MAANKRTRKFKGFAALDRRGNLVWGTFSVKKPDAQEKFDKWNPDPTGEGMGETIVPVEIFIAADDGTSQ